MPAGGDPARVSGRGRRAARGSQALLLAGLAVVVLVFYWVEASLRKTPWLFTDELEWSQLSRAIAATGHAARRGQPHSFESLYSYLIAPAWWIHSTATAYAAIKAENTVVMCLTALPAYLLARLLLSRRASLVVAVASIAIPAMSYATSIVPEPLAYLWFACAALLRRPRCWPRRASRAPSRRSCSRCAGPLGPLGVRRAAGRARAGSGDRLDDRAWRLALLARSASACIALELAVLALFGYALQPARRRARPALAVPRSTSTATPCTGRARGGRARDRARRRAGDRRARLALAARAVRRPRLPGVRRLPAREHRRPLGLHGGQGDVTCSRTCDRRSRSATSSTSRRCSCRDGARPRSPARLDWRLVAAATALVLVIVWSPAFEVGAPYFEAPGLAILDARQPRASAGTCTDFHWLLLAATAVFLVLARASPPPRRPGARRPARVRLAPDRPDLRDDRQHRRGEQLREDAAAAPRTGSTSPRTARRSPSSGRRSRTTRTRSG